MPQTPTNPYERFCALQISQVGMEMAVPAMLGFGVDYWLGTLPWFLVAGAVLGPVIAFVHLMNILHRPNPSQDSPK